MGVLVKLIIYFYLLSNSNENSFVKITNFRRSSKPLPDCSHEHPIESCLPLESDQIASASSSIRVN